jgi:Stf0 sulphotransferase
MRSANSRTVCLKKPTGRDLGVCLPQLPSHLYDPAKQSAPCRLLVEGHPIGRMAFTAEAGIQELFSEGGIVPPLTSFTKTLCQQYEQTIGTVLGFLDLDDRSVTIPEPHLAKTSYDISEEWVQRFRKERQAERKNSGWSLILFPDQPQCFTDDQHSGIDPC